MKKLAAFLFWGAIASVAFFITIVWLAGQARNSAGAKEQTCTTPLEALDAADQANRKMLGDPPDYKRTQVLINDDTKGIRVGVIYRANGQNARASSFTVGPDCSIVGIN